MNLLFVFDFIHVCITLIFIIKLCTYYQCRVIAYANYFYCYLDFRKEGEGLDSTVSRETIDVWMLTLKCEVMKENGRLQKQLRINAVN